MTAPEFSRTVRADTLGSAPRSLTIEANEAERAAVAERFGLIGIARLSAEAALTRSGETVTASGTVSAAVTQSCVATGEPVEAEVEDAFRVEFRPQPRVSGAEEEIELGEGELDVVFYDGASVDVGEVAAETLSLALDPYPRSAAADAALREAGVKDEEEARAGASPFAALMRPKGGEEPQ